MLHEVHHGVKDGGGSEPIAVVLVYDAYQPVLPSLTHGECVLARVVVGVTDKEGGIPGKRYPKTSIPGTSQ